MTSQESDANRSAAASVTEAELLSVLFQLVNGAESVLPNSSPTIAASPQTNGSTGAPPGDRVAPNPELSGSPALDRSPAPQPEPQPLDVLAVPIEESSIDELQKLLLGFDPAQLSQLRERLENPALRAADVGQILHQALLLQALNPDQREQWVVAMVSTVEQAIRKSVRQDETVLADAIFPVVGIASRKAIASALETMMQRLDQMLEQSLSPQALQWRLEAMRTGRPFAEVLVLRTLRFRVEQVFLIHRATGLLLQHVVAPSITAQDPDLVSAMLQAIQNFVQDSFTVQTGDALETLRFGDLTIWIEQSPQAVLASVLRGHAPVSVRSVFCTAIERIHQELGLLLANFQGDSAPFILARPHLEACLLTEYKTSNRQKGRPVLWVLLTLVAIGLAVGSYREWQVRQRWAAYLEQLRAEPGIVVSTAKRRWGGFLISGLRDPLAPDPAQSLPTHQIDADRVQSEWHPFLSLHPKIVVARAKQILQPPATVQLSVNQNGILLATGSAPEDWIETSQQLGPTIPGVTQVHSKVAIAELQSLAASRQWVEAQVLRFEEGSTDLAPGRQPTLNSLTREITTLKRLATQLHRQVRIQLIGRSNPRGSPAQNLLLSQQRADVILSKLVAAGIKPTDLVAIGIGSNQPLSNPQFSNEQLDRSVTFKVLFTERTDPRIDTP